MNIIVRVLPLLLTTALLLGGCGADKKQLAWDGEWQRTIHVPQNVQGRCVDEQMRIDGRNWQLRAIVHSTFECNQPFLEVVYEGDLHQVQIRRDTDDREMILQIEDIHLLELVDIAGDDRAVLSGAALRSLSPRYIPADNRYLSLPVRLSADGSRMRSTVFPPVLALSISEHPQPDMTLFYQRVEQAEETED